MTGKGNRFGIGPLDVSAPLPSRRNRDPGPMSVAVRESAASAQESSEALVEQRRQNASDAKEFRTAQAEGRVLVRLPVDRIGTDALPRDRMDLAGVAASDEMDELKASIRERGQREPVEVFLTGDGAYQLKTGWRRLAALRQLHAETNDARFAVITARVTTEGDDRAALYVDMVEENVIRADLSFAEMAQIAIALSKDSQAGVGSVEEAVTRLFRSLHKVKRAYIRSFVSLLQALDGALPFPKAVARDLGVDVARKLQDAGTVGALRRRLAEVETETQQAEVLRAFLAGTLDKPGPASASKGAEKQKFEFHVGDSKVTARNGECRIKSAVDFASVERQVLERAVRAFHAALRDRG
jgi:ParB family chromosome partitioning protein